MLSRTAKGAALAVVLGLVVALMLLFTIGPYRAYVVHTGSMEPTIPSESLVVVHKGQVRPGQVISFYWHGTVVTHRLIKVNRDGTLQTKGDGNATVDTGRLPPNEVIGNVVSAPRYLGWLAVAVGSWATGILILCLGGLAYLGLTGKNTSKQLNHPETPA